MKKISKIIDIALYVVIGIVATAALTSAVWNRPMLFTSIRSNSMYPLFRRGDMVLIDNISEKDEVKVGDIVVFKALEGSLASKGWIVHRIVEGNEDTGYITKGDANEYTDQASGGTGAIQRQWITGRVLTAGGMPMKIPLIGYLPLWLEGLRGNAYVMPSIAVALALIVGISEIIAGNKRRKKRKRGLELQCVYFFGGLTISIIMGATMLASSQRIVIPYEVSDKSAGVLMNSDIGIIKVGDEVERPLSEICNNGFMPVIAVITTEDSQLSFSHTSSVLKAKDKIEVQMQLRASIPGKYKSSVYIGMFYPFLPESVIYSLAQKNYWLALAAISMIPGLPLIFYPIIEGRLRRKTAKEFRRMFRQIERVFSSFN